MTAKNTYRKNPALYEINTAAWLFELSKRQGKPLTLRKVPSQEWDRLKSYGFDFVWLMGVWNRSKQGRKLVLEDPVFRNSFLNILPGCTDEDIIGSCFSVGSYEPDPLIGTWEDLEYARKELNKRGIGLVLDFVPNHTGVDHPWVFEHPEFYINVGKQDYLTNKEAYFQVEFEGKTSFLAHGKDPYFPPWMDTAQLNYFNPDTRAAMINRLKKISCYCDGVRCDMAMLVLNKYFQQDWGWTIHSPGYQMPEKEFWAEAIQSVPELVYIAEAYWDTEWTLQQLGFDFVYDKRLYDRINHGPTREIYLHLTAEISFQEKLVRFIENHDEARSLTALGKSKAEAAAVLFSTLPGMRFYFQGQFEGLKIKMPLQIRQTRFEPIDQEVLDFYQKLMKSVNAPIFHNGMWRLKPVFEDVDKSFENLVAYLWKQNSELRLVIVNFSQSTATGRICFQDDVSEEMDYVFRDVFSGNTFTSRGLFMAHPGLSFNLEGLQGQIFDITPGKLD